MSVEIIIKKMQKLIDAPGSCLTFGDVRTQMAHDLLKKLAEVIESKANYGKTYWLMVHTSLNYGVRGHSTMKEKILILPEKPRIKYIGTCLFRIDPVNADAEVEYILPLDIPALSIVAPESAKNGQVWNDAKGLPIFNRRLN